MFSSLCLVDIIASVMNLGYIAQQCVCSPSSKKAYLGHWNISHTPWPFDVVLFPTMPQDWSQWWSPQWWSSICSSQPLCHCTPPPQRAEDHHGDRGRQQCACLGAPVHHKDTQPLSTATGTCTCIEMNFTHTICTRNAHTHTCMHVQCAHTCIRWPFPFIHPVPRSGVSSME